MASWTRAERRGPRRTRFCSGGDRYPADPAYHSVERFNAVYKFTRAGWRGNPATAAVGCSTCRHYSSSACLETGQMQRRRCALCATITCAVRTSSVGYGAAACWRISSTTSMFHAGFIIVHQPVAQKAGLLVIGMAGDGTGQRFGTQQVAAPPPQSFRCGAKKRVAGIENHAEMIAVPDSGHGWPPTAPRHSPAGELNRLPGRAPPFRPPRAMVSVADG